MATIEKKQTKGELTSGADILVQSLVNQGVETIFAYPGGASMPLHQALTRFSDKLRTILPRHEQGGAFRRARLLTRSTGRVGVCMGNQWPRSHQSGDRHRRRQAGQHPHDRHHRPGAHQA